ncbi:MAG: AMP-binding protein [Lentisphaerae bacterium]|nr:AMP-binding protein [Lentisphaerota bacterium]
MSQPSQNHNIAHWLPHWSALAAARTALRVPVRRGFGRRPAWAGWTFRELDAAADRYARRLQGLGVGPGMLALLMVRPGLDFYALTFALFKLGAVPVLIDPGMGWRSFMACVAQAAPEAFLGIPAAHLLRRLVPGPFRSVRVAAVLGRWSLPGAAALRGGMATASVEAFPVHPVQPDDLAAVLFTTGSTGPAKGVAYSHRIFSTQVELLRREYGIGPADVDLPCFPLFGLFSTALGATAVIPDMDPSRPAHVDPRRIVDPILEHGVTYSFGSPTLWARVGRACAARGQRLPTLTRVIMAGAPVSAAVHEVLLGKVLPEGAATWTPYGATEALPVCNFGGREMLAETAAATRAGAGMCVGRPLPEVCLRIIRLCDAPIETWDEALVLPAGEVGEVVVKGPVVTAQYHRLPAATRLAKIREGEAVWHRMGDVGYLDDQGRLWFCGRLAHRVTTSTGTLYSVCCEAIFNAVPGVRRSALVGLADGASAATTPAIVVEPEPGAWPRTARERDTFRERLLSAGAASPVTREIRRVFFRRAFPVDIRHNAKIRRDLLAAWAARQMGG